METDCLEQREGRIFVTAGVKCIVLLEAQPFQNVTLKYCGTINQETICPSRGDIRMNFKLLSHSNTFIFYLLYYPSTHPCWGHRIYWQSRITWVLLCTELYYWGKITRTAQKTTMHIKAQHWSTHSNRSWPVWKNGIFCASGWQKQLESNLHSKRNQTKPLNPTCLSFP